MQIRNLQKWLEDADPEGTVEIISGPHKFIIDEAWYDPGSGKFFISVFGEGHGQEQHKNANEGGI